MNYKTKVGARNIEIAPEENHMILADNGQQTYVAWQCKTNGDRVVGWGGYPNAMKALADVKRKLS